jgi:hypothetical protein
MLKERPMRLKILVSLMGILAVVLVVLEVQYHYIYWAVAPKPKAIPRFLESRTNNDQAETATVVAEGTTGGTPVEASQPTSIETRAADKVETPAEVQAESPAETPAENPAGTPAEDQPEIDKSAS